MILSMRSTGVSLKGATPDRGEGARSVPDLDAAIDPQHDPDGLAVARGHDRRERAHPHVERHSLPGDGWMLGLRHPGGGHDRHCQSQIES